MQSFSFKSLEREINFLLKVADEADLDAKIAAAGFSVDEVDRVKEYIKLTKEQDFLDPDKRDQNQVKIDIIKRLDLNDGKTKETLSQYNLVQKDADTVVLQIKTS